MKNFANYGAANTNDEEEDSPLLRKYEADLESRNKIFKSSMQRVLKGIGVFTGIAAACLVIVAILGSQNKSKSSSIVEEKIMTTDGGEKRPNFIFVLIDDMGYGTIGNDQSDIVFASPFMNQLAKDGVMMTNYYAQEICSPSRASLLTGRYPITLGFQYEELGPDVDWGLNTTEVLLSDILRLDGNYKNYMVGKWNLGHFSPEYLPTARGFDHFVGFLTGQVYHWSKIMPVINQYVDFMYSDRNCYDAYRKEDLETYSTFFYRDRAIDVIKYHDFDTKPMFLYIAPQAVHDPFDDNTTFANGLPSNYFADGVYDMFKSKIPAQNRLQYALSLRLLDDAVADVVKAMEERGQMRNTYLIVASDNGGCYQAGGRNGNLRGCKGSLYEGGVKVDAFIYSPLFSDSVRGTKYNGLMHVSDWMPTILELGKVDYTPALGHDLDGYSQVSAILGESPSPRDHILYNIYYNVDKESFDLNENAALGVRKGNFKLLHAFVGNEQAEWYNFSTPLDDDSDMESGSCPQMLALRGAYTKWLFDLEKDPNETTNLYSDPTYRHIKEELYALMYYYLARTARDIAPSDSSIDANVVFDQNGGYVLPWKIANVAEGRTVPKQCTPDTIFSISRLF